MKDDIKISLVSKRDNPWKDFWRMWQKSGPKLIAVVRGTYSKGDAKAHIEPEIQGLELSSDAMVESSRLFNFCCIGGYHTRNSD